MFYLFVCFSCRIFTWWKYSSSWSIRNESHSIIQRCRRTWERLEGAEFLLEHLDNTEENPIQLPLAHWNNSHSVLASSLDDKFVFIPHQGSVEDAAYSIVFLVFLKTMNWLGTNCKEAWSNKEIVIWSYYSLITQKLA